MKEEIQLLREKFLDFSDVKPYLVFRLDEYGYRMVSKKNGALKSIYLIRNLNTQECFKFTVYLKLLLKTTVI